MGASSPVPLSLEPQQPALATSCPGHWAGRGWGWWPSWEGALWEEGGQLSAGAVRLASPALQAGLDTQGLLTEEWEELCSQLSEPSGRLEALEQTQNVAGGIARRGPGCRKPWARTEPGGWDQGQVLRAGCGGAGVQSSGGPTLVPCSAFPQLGDPGHGTYPLLSKPALSAPKRAPSHASGCLGLLEPSGRQWAREQPLVLAVAPGWRFPARGAQGEGLEATPSPSGSSTAPCLSDVTQPGAPASPDAHGARQVLRKSESGRVGTVANWTAHALSRGASSLHPTGMRAQRGQIAPFKRSRNSVFI